jgi:uncharacterized membrane protein YdjX (TVP38/TMEM64 family)
MTAVILNHRLSAFADPPKDNARRTTPTTRIAAAIALEKFTYSDNDLPNTMAPLVLAQKASDYTKSMHPRSQKNLVRRSRLAAWAGFAAVFLLLYYTRPEFVGTGLRASMKSSVLLGYALYLLMGAVRGFTLIPATHLVIFAIPLFPAVPLFILSVIGILVSSTSVYYLAESFHLAEYFESRHPRTAEKIRAALQRNTLAIVTVWSFFPLTPSDLMCYVCGVMRISFSTFILGVLIGEGAICAIYIFAGRSVLQVLGFGVSS